MNTTQPIEINGQSYPFYSANLAITSFFKDGEFEANAAMRLVPTRLDENGNAVTADDQAKSVLVGTTKGITGAEEEAMNEIYMAIQKYINVKGL